MRVRGKGIVEKTTLKLCLFFCIHLNNNKVGETKKKKVIRNTVKFNLSPAFVLATTDMDSISS